MLLELGVWDRVGRGRFFRFGGLRRVRLARREVLSLLVRRGTVSSWYLIARRVLQYQITIY